MSEFPTVGLGVDLTGIDEGERAYSKLKRAIAGVGEAAAGTDQKVQASADKVKSANQGAGRSAEERAATSTRAAQTEARASALATKEQEQQRRYLQRVRITSFQMEDAARRRDDMEQARVSARQIKDADRVAREAERAQRQSSAAAERARQQETKAAEKAAKDQESIERGILAFRIRMHGQEFRQSTKYDADTLAFKQRMWAQQTREARTAYDAEVKASNAAAAQAERNRRYLMGVRIRSAAMESAAEAKSARERAQADRRAAEEAERNRKYLLSVRLTSIKMEEAAQRAADREAQNRARALAAASRGGGGGIRIPGGGGGSGSGPVGRGDLNLISAAQEALARLRGSLADTRRLFFDLRTAIGVFLGAMIVRPIFDMADAMTALKARIAAFTTSSTDVPYLMEAVFQAAQRSRAPLESIATLYTRLAPLAKQLGKSQMELLRISETVAKGFQIGGATPEEAKSASQQLAQALASNRLGGDELRSLAENAPILMAKIAAALNMNTGQFIKWAHEGKATAEVVVGALEKAQADIDRIFNAFPVTIAQGVTLVRNSLANLIGKVNEATGASVAIATMIANFSAFLDSAHTIEVLTTAINGLVTGLDYLGKAFGFVASMWPIIATVLAGMAASRLIAIASAWMLASKAVLAFQAASVIAGRGAAVLMVAQTGLAASAAAVTRGFSAMLAMVGGPLGAAVIALVTVFTLVKRAQDDAASAAERFKNSQEGAVNALSRALGFAQAYGLKTESLTAAMNQATGATKTNNGVQDQAMKAAMARAEAERLLTVRILERSAADAGDEARKSLKSVTGIAGLRNQRTINELNLKNPLLSKVQRDAIEKGNANLDQQIIDASKGAIEGFGLERMLKAQAEEMRNAKLNITIPDTSGPPTAPDSKNKDKNKRNPFEGALDGIQKMEQAIAGLKAEIASISANPLDVLAAQIRRAGDEAAASLEAGDRQNQGLADKTRALAMEKERLTIIKQMIEESAQNTRQIEAQSDAESTLAAAQAASNDVMKEFWGSGSRGLDAYNAALERSRQITTDAQVAASDLEIAQRYGVENLNDLTAALTSKTGVELEYATRVRDSAMAEQDAAEAAIRRKAAMDAFASRDADLLGFNESTFEGLERALDHMSVMADGLGDSLAAAFGRGGRAAQQMLKVVTDQQNRELAGRKRVADARVKYDIGGKRSVESLKIEGEVADEMAQARVQGYAMMVDAAQGFFKENSVGYKVLQAAEIALHTLTTLNTIQAMALDSAHTATSVANSGARASADGVAAYAKTLASLPFPYNIAAGLAVLGALASVGVMLAGGGGGGGSKPSNMETRQKTQGTGSVLGDATAKSDSIARALEIVASNTNRELEFSNDMLTALRSIDSNIGTLTASLARQLGVGGFLSSDAPGLGKTTKGASDLTALALGGPVGVLVSKLPIIGGIIDTLFGSSKKTTLQDAGISFGSGSLSDILNQGISGQTYQDIATQTKKKAFGLTYSNKTKTSTTTADLDANIATEITRVIESLRAGVLSAASLLGVDGAAAALDAMQINLGKLSFKDMTGEEIEAALQSVFSKLGDDMATLALPMITELQKAGEGAFETLIRVARDYQVLDVSLAQIGKTFGAVGISSLAARQRLIELAGGIDELASQTAFYAENFLSDQERIAPVIKAVYSELGKLGYGSIKTRDEFKALVNSLDLTTESGATAFATLMRLAPGFAAITDYMTELSTANDNVSTAQSSLNDAYSTAADLIGEVRDKFQGFVDTFSAFRQQLETGPLAENSPQDQYLKSKALFESTRDSALGGNEQALADLQSVSEAYLAASRDYYASTEPYFRDLEAVKMAVDAAQAYAQTQVDKADAQLAQLNLMVNGLVTVNTSVLTVAQAVNNVQTAITALATATAAQAAAIAAAQAAAQQAANQNPAGGVNNPANQNAIDYARYGAANPDLVENYRNGGILSEYATLEEALRAHYQNTGQDEIASGGRSLYGTQPATSPAAPAPAAAPAVDLEDVVAGLTAVGEKLDINNFLVGEVAKRELAAAEENLEELSDLKRTYRSNAA